MMDVLFRLTRHKSMTRTVAKRSFGYIDGERPIQEGYYIKQLYVKQETIKEFRVQVPGSREDFNSDTLERIVDKCDRLMDKALSEKELPKKEYKRLLSFGNYTARY
jgi:hypothetical protein